MTGQEPYELVHRYPHLELRRYPAHVVAGVQVNAPFDRPVTLPSGTCSITSAAATRPGRKLAITAPVIQSGPLPGSDASADFVVAFVLPAGLTAERRRSRRTPR
jgi:hypothetical protein